MLPILLLELHTSLRTPALLLIGTLFLLVQGASLVALLPTLTDPARPAPLGTVLEVYLGGTVLGWALLLAVIALLATRTFTEPARSGEWDALLSCGVSERVAILGKLAASAVLLAALWAPTALSLAVVASYVRSPAPWDVPATFAGYLGVWALACGVLAWCAAACAATRSPLLAGAAATFVGLALLLAGELSEMTPELVGEHPTLAAVTRAVSLRRHAAALARGELTATSLAWIVGVGVCGASAAITAATWGRRRRATVRARAVATLLLMAAAALATAAAQRGGAAWDLSARGRNTLSDATLSVLAELRGPAELIVVEPTLGALLPLYQHAAQVLERMDRASAQVGVRVLDPAALPGGLTQAARDAGVAPRDLAASGAIVVRAAGRQRVIDLFELAELSPSDAGPDLARWSAERAVAARLGELLHPVPVSVCASTSHGEAALAAGAPDAAPDAAASTERDYAALAQRLRDDGVQLLPHAGGPVPDGCDVVLVAAPTLPWSPEAAFELSRFVERGGGLVVGLASRSLDDAGRPLRTGLELLLAAAGLATPPAVAVDPSAELGAGALRVLDGYAAHEINRGFPRTRATVWWTPRVITVTAPAQALVTAGPQSWGETELSAAAPARDADDLPGPVALAGALDRPEGGRIVVLGSMESAASAVLAGGSALDLWLARALRWAARRPLPAMPVVEQSPQVARAVMTRAERRAVAALCLVGVPGLWLLGGLALRRWRRQGRP